MKEDSDLYVLEKIKETIDYNTMLSKGVSEERLLSFFKTIRQLISSPANKNLKYLKINVDGASRGNPGRAGIGIVIKDSSGKVLKEIREFIGNTTNNVAEYRAMLRALEVARDLKGDSLLILTDSEMVANQLNGKYKVKSKDLIHLYDLAKERISSFQKVTIQHVPRNQNKDADNLANLAIDSVNS